MYVQGIMEDEGEIEYVVDLVWIVGMIGSYDYVVMGGMGQFWFDFWVWV